MRAFTIGTRTITDESAGYVIAELSHNHQGSRLLAQDMIRVARECGADAVKLQKRSASFYDALRAKGLKDYAALREARELTESDYWVLKILAHTCGLDFIVTAFDVESLAFVLRIGVDAVKLASGAVYNPLLLHAAAEAQAPVLLSTGGADMPAITAACQTFCAKQVRADALCLLQCTSAYPCPPEEMHLGVLTTYREYYPSTIVGLSSHSPVNVWEPVAYALGARVFEKHFTLSKALGAGDHANSLEPRELRELVTLLRQAPAVIGTGEKRFLPCEETGRIRLDVGYHGKEEA